MVRAAAHHRGGARLWRKTCGGWRCVVVCVAARYFVPALGSTVKRMLHEVNPETQLAWNDGKRELWLAASDGGVQVLMPSGRTYSRDLALGNLYSDPTHALAVTSAGNLVNLSHEVPAVKNVLFLSHPFEIDVTKRLKGYRGTSSLCQRNRLRRWR